MLGRGDRLAQDVDRGPKTRPIQGGDRGQSLLERLAGDEARHDRTRQWTSDGEAGHGTSTRQRDQQRAHRPLRCESDVLDKAHHSVLPGLCFGRG